MRRTLLATIFLLGLPCGASGEPDPRGRRSEAERFDAYAASEQAFQRGLASQRRGDGPSATVHYQAALEGDPDFVEAKVNLAQVYFEIGKPGIARLLLDQAQAQHPGYPRVYALRGVMLLHQGEARRAVEELAHAHALAPYDLETLNNLGCALIDRGLAGEARDVLEKALRIDPSHPEATLNLAIAEDLAGRRAHALYRYQRFLELANTRDPARVDVRERIHALSRADVGDGPVPEVASPPPTRTQP